MNHIKQSKFLNTTISLKKNPEIQKTATSILNHIMKCSTGNSYVSSVKKVICVCIIEYLFNCNASKKSNWREKEETPSHPTFEGQKVWHKHLKGLCKL